MGDRQMGNSLVNQQSKFAPAVCFHKGRFHMVFAAANDSNDLLHAVSQDGLNWSRLQNLRQSTKQAPAIVSFNNQLICVFVANNDTNTLLKCSWADEQDDIWSNNESIGESTKTGPTLIVASGAPQVFFIADNSSDNILISDG
jgi:hypothetical protein